MTGLYVTPVSGHLFIVCFCWARQMIANTRYEANAIILLKHVVIIVLFWGQRWSRLNKLIQLDGIAWANNTWDDQYQQGPNV